MAKSKIITKTPLVLSKILISVSVLFLISFVVGKYKSQVYGQGGYESLEVCESICPDDGEHYCNEWLGDYFCAVTQTLAECESWCTTTCTTTSDSDKYICDAEEDLLPVCQNEYWTKTVSGRSLIDCSGDLGYFQDCTEGGFPMVECVYTNQEVIEDVVPANCDNTAPWADVNYICATGCADLGYYDGICNENNICVCVSRISDEILDIIDEIEEEKLLEEENKDCNFNLTKLRIFTKCVFESVQKDVANALDIRRTIMDMTSTMSTDAPMYAATGKGIDQATACLCKDKSICPEVDAELQKLMNTLSNADCATFHNNPMSVAAGVEEPPLYGGQSGSLAGIVMKASTLVYEEPLPISLAYYSRHLASKIPFVKNTTYAQTIETSMFPGFDIVLKLWQLVRNFAFALVASFMVVTGIMIMMRKQLNPKTAVTVQNAIPRLVISLALISFSYAIGALFIALIGPLISVSLEPIRIASRTVGTSGPIATFFGMMLGSSEGVGITFVAVLLYIVAFLVLLGTFAMAIFKLLVSYIEALALVVIAPLQFAWGSIPGNEESIMSWFKAMAVAVLSIPAITAGLSFGLYFAWSALSKQNAASTAANAVGPLASGWLSAGVNGWGVILTPIMVIAIFMFSSKLPAKLKEGIMEKY